ncbi:hypothetical protein CH375_18660 [Leptospira ellisii]|uniref:Uncharacterized protein n=1 Tax=Leptospira ellisii TaxID=2023197 RepID=A0A2N0BGN0_9LEPT|nr:hypothetical protein CH379_06835 [Leptospira ellisii]PKA03157.1 hypothetical protein CH375_18660 [Leptospira ellisii]
MVRIKDPWEKIHRNFEEEQFLFQNHSPKNNGNGSFLERKHPGFPTEKRSIFPKIFGNNFVRTRFVFGFRRNESMEVGGSGF